MPSESPRLLWQNSCSCLLYAVLVSFCLSRHVVVISVAFSSRLGYEEHIPGQTRDWNEELQTTRELPRKHLPERLIRERTIFKVHSDFVVAATRGAMSVIDGNIMAINPGEDTKFVFVIFSVSYFFSLECGFCTIRTWTMSSAAVKRNKAFEMWLWRKMEKISWTEKVSNSDVLKRVEEVRCIISTIKQRKCRWLGHVLRHDMLLRDILEGRMTGKWRREDLYITLFRMPLFWRRCSEDHYRERSQGHCAACRGTSCLTLKLP